MDATHKSAILRVGTLRAVLLLSLSCPHINAAERLPKLQRFSSVHKLLVDSVDHNQIAGAVALVVEGGRVVYEDAVGWQSKSERVPMSNDTLFRIASMTKPITSVAILMLCEEGKLHLHDRVSMYLPEFQNVQVVADEPEDTLRPSKREITIRDLLNHTSGISYGFLGRKTQTLRYRAANISDGLSETTFPLSENVRRIASCPLTADPGEQWQYGLSTDVLGRVVEVVSGQPLDCFFHDRIFGPLGMDDTSFFVPKCKACRLATLYRPTKDGMLHAIGVGVQRNQNLIYSATFQSHGRPPYLSGGAGLVSTARDYSRFLSMLLGSGAIDGVRLLQPESVAQMTSNQIGDLRSAFPIHGDRYGYGVGVSVDTANESGASQGAFSWGGLFHTFFWVDPEREVIGILMTQLIPFDHLTLWKDYQSRVYQATGIDHHVKAAVGPQPGDVYRESWTHFNGNRSWRVTDPNARAAGAQEFLPNPELRIVIGNLEHAVRAEILLERWGGHPKTGDKRIRFNRRDWLVVPEIATTPQPAEYYYSQDNPIIEVPLNELHEGENTFEATCSGINGCDWPQWGLFSACVRVYYDAEAIDDVPRGNIASPEPGATIRDYPTIVVQAQSPFGVSRVDVLANYYGYDENGDGEFCDWHHSYFKQSRAAMPQMAGHIGSDSEPPFELTWDTSWVPDQGERPIAIVARIQDRRGIWRVTDEVEDVRLIRHGTHVALFRPIEFPREFGVRAGEDKSCSIDIPESFPLERATAAVLPLRTWHGWDSDHRRLTLNAYEFPVAGKDHLYDFDLHPIPVNELKSGNNRFRIRSDTNHHMLEVLWPGPALLVRYPD